MFFFTSVESKVRLFTNKQGFVTLLHLRFQAISEFVRGNIELYH